MGLSAVNQCTKFEVFRFTRYEAVNGGAKCRKWGGLHGAVRGHSRSSAMSPFDRARTTSYSTLIETMRLSCTRFWDIAGYLSKVTDFDPPHLHLASLPIRVAPVKFRGDLWRQKTRLPPCAIMWFCLCDPVFSRFSRTATCDRQTDTGMDTGPWLVLRMHSIAR